MLQLNTSGSITQETLLKQLHEGEVLGDAFDVEEEVESTQRGGMVEAKKPEEPDEEPDEEETNEE